MSRKGCPEIVRAAAISECYSKLIGKDKRKSITQRLRVIDSVKRTKNVTSEELLKRKVVYHEGCYSSFANIANLNHAKKRFSASIDTGRPSKATSSDTTQTEKIETRSQHDSYNKSACSICQEGGFS